MDQKEKVFKNFILYAVTDLKAASGAELKKIEAAYRGGADIVQIRSRVLPDSALLKIGQKVQKIAARYRKLFFVNDRVDLAVLLHADGVHLGQDDMPLREARNFARRAGAKLRFGISTHNLSQALRAEKQGADYIGVGPVFSTPTKPGRKGTGLRFVRQVAKRIKIPFVAIGGINLKNINRVARVGAKRVAVVRAIFSAKDPAGMAKNLRTNLTRAHNRKK